VIHGFAGGMGVAVYCARAVKEYSQFMGAQTPISTRHAAATRFMLKGKDVRRKGHDRSRRENLLLIIV